MGCHQLLSWPYLELDGLRTLFMAMAINCDNCDNQLINCALISMCQKPRVVTRRSGRMASNAGIQVPTILQWVLIANYLVTCKRLVLCG
jgi:hypothetical protein